MTIGVCNNQSILASMMLKKSASNGNVGPPGDLNTNISQQVVSQLARYYSDVEKYDNSTAGNNETEAFAELPENSNAPQKAVSHAFYPITGLQSSSQEDEDQTKKMLDEIDTLKQKSYSANKSAFKKLVELSKSTTSSFSGMVNKSIDTDAIAQKAKNTVYELIDEAPGYPNMFQMITESGLLDKETFGDAADLPSKLINEAATSTKAMQQLQKLLSSGTFRLEDYAQEAIEKDPNSAVATLVQLGLGNRSKDQGITIANLLSDVATNRAGSQAGSMAAKGLKQIIKKEGQNAILRAAFDGLTKAAMSGNTDALQSLEDLVTDPTISKNKAMKAVESLTKVASSGNASGGKATKILVGLANNKRLAPQIREKVVDGLTEIANSGNGNAAMASDALLNLAKLPQDSIGKKALANVMSLKNKDSMDQGKLNEVMQNAARSNKTDISNKKGANNFLNSTQKQPSFANNNVINMSSFFKNKFDQTAAAKYSTIPLFSTPVKNNNQFASFVNTISDFNINKFNQQKAVL